MSDQKMSKEDHVKNLRRNGMSLAEANRWVYGWSDPAMKEFWNQIIKSRPKDSPQFSQKEAFKTILKTVFGREFTAGQKYELPHQSYLEIIEIVVEGIQNGHVATRSIKLTKPTREDLFHKARSEFKRLLQDDEDFKLIRHVKD